MPKVTQLVSRSRSPQPSRLNPPARVLPSSVPPPRLRRWGLCAVLNIKRPLIRLIQLVENYSVMFK